MMNILGAENRNMSIKPKHLRRDGIIPGVLYGKNLEESLSIQFSRTEVERFFKANSEGTTVELVIGHNKYPALLREAIRKPSTNELEHLSFQTLLAGEAITSSARLVLLNRDKVTGMIQQPQTEVSYRTLPVNLVDSIEIDLEGMGIGDSMRVSDLDIAKNPDIEILTPLDEMVYSIVDSRVSAATEAEEETPEIVEEAPATE